MNHPLSRNELSGAENNSENPAETPVPSWLTQHYRDDDAEFLVNQYRRKQEDEPAAPSAPPENRTYEYYRRRIMERQREQLDQQMERAPMPQVPSRPTLPVSELDVQHRHYGNEREAVERPVSYASTYERPRLRKSLLLAGVFAAVAGGAVGLPSRNMTRFRIRPMDFTRSLPACCPANQSRCLKQTAKRRSPKSPSPSLPLRYLMSRAPSTA